MTSKRTPIHGAPHRRRTLALWLLTASALTGTGCDSKGPPEPEPSVYQVSEAIPYGYLERFIFTPISDYVPPECLETRYYYCPPLDEVWQSQVTLNSCTGEVLAIGECAEIFECNPTHFHLEAQACVTEVGQSGQQSVFCDKGELVSGPCVPCGIEVCNGLDDDCDGVVDDLADRACETPCGEGVLLCIEGVDLCLGTEPSDEVCDGVDNDCDGETDEGELNPCGECGSLPEELCDGLDNDCDGEVDEGVFMPCASPCGQGVRTCSEGAYGPCSATPAVDEVCNGLDDDCDGEVDEGLSCACNLADLGALYPCQSSPLICGQGWQECQCADEACTSTLLSECHALCWFTTGDGGDCVDEGQPTDELCNAHDDNCDGQIDEALTRSCYSGPAGTADTGTCMSGEQSCKMGMWGQETSEGFLPGECPGEVLPAPHDYCNGSDEDCDGVVDDGETMIATDIVLIVDWSASMEQELNAVLGALVAFAQAYSDDELLKWSVMIGPVGNHVTNEELILVSDLSPFEPFMETMLSLDAYPKSGMYEMFLDALWMSLGGTTAAQEWEKIKGSTPSKEEFALSWREDAQKVIILWTDEAPQSQLEPAITKPAVQDLLNVQSDLYTYVFTSPYEQSNWQAIAEAGGGALFELSTSTSVMFTALMEILDEAVCL